MTRGVFGLVALLSAVSCAEPEPEPPLTCTTNAGLEPSSAGEDDAFIVRVRNGTSLAALDGAREVTLGSKKVYAVAGRAVRRLALARDPGVLSVEPDYAVHAQGLDFAPVARGSEREYGPGLEMVGAIATWDADRDGVIGPHAVTGAGVRICVLDGGIDRRHSELQLPVVGGKDFVDEDDDYSDQTRDLRGTGHGTKVAGILAAQLGSGGQVAAGMPLEGVVGAAPGASLLIARVLDVSGNGHVSSVIRALDWCRQERANIVTVSLASASHGPAEEEAFAEASAAGMLVLAATGNGGNDRAMGYPAAYPSVLPVGAVDDAFELAHFSQTGFTAEHPGVVAPGWDILAPTLVGGSAVAAVSSNAAGARAGEVVDRAAAGDYRGPLVDCRSAKESASCSHRTCGFVALLEHDVERDGVLIDDKVRDVLAQGAGAVIVANANPEVTGAFLSLGTAKVRWPTVVAVDAATGKLLRETASSAPVELQFRRFDYARFSGTSAAVPHAAAVAALIWSARPELSACQVRSLLLAGARDLGPAGPDPRFGQGLVQAPVSLALPTPSGC